jgi:hypothetical protein
VGQDNLKLCITKYYKTLFGDPTPSNFSLSEETNHDLPQLSNPENETATFCEKEVYEAVC